MTWVESSTSHITAVVNDINDERDNNDVIEDKATSNAIGDVNDRVDNLETRVDDLETRLDNELDIIRKYLGINKDGSKVRGEGNSGGSNDSADDRRRDWETAMFHKMSQMLYKADGKPVYYKNHWGEVIDLRAVKQIFNGKFILKQEYVDATGRHSVWYDAYSA